MRIKRYRRHRSDWQMQHVPNHHDRRGGQRRDGI